MGDTDKVFPAAAQQQSGWLRLPPITINVHGAITIHAGDPCFQEKVLDRLTGLKAQGAHIMSQLSDLQQDVADINTATDTIAAEMDALKAQVVPGMTQEAVDGVHAALQATAARLKSIGSPAAPAGNVPPTEPTPVTPPTA